MKTARRKHYEARYRKVNRKALRVKARRYYRKNAASIKAKQSKYAKTRRLRAYNLTASREATMLSAQNNRCAICKGGSPKSNGGVTWLIDHDHSSGKVRGLLCQACNLILGHAKDNVGVLKSAIQYLLKHKKSVKLER